MTEQRTRLDFAQTIRWLVDEVYPEARVIRLVMDNLNTHSAASLYEAFPPEEAGSPSLLLNWVCVHLPTGPHVSVGQRR